MSNPRKATVIYLILGLIASAVYCIYDYKTQTLFGGTASPTFMGSSEPFFGLLRHVDGYNANFPSYLCFSSILFCVLYALTYNEKHNVRLMMTSLVLAFILGTPLLQFDVSSGPISITNGASSLLAFLLAIYIAHSFHYAYHQNNYWKTPYSALFAAVWDSSTVLLVTFFLVGIGECVIYIATESSGLYPPFISSFSLAEYLNQYSFIHSILFFLCLCIAKQHDDMIQTLRGFIQHTIRDIFPLLGLISIAYFIFHLIHMNIEFNSMIMALKYLLGTQFIIGIVFFNACFQTGNELGGITHSVLLRLRIYFITLFCLTLVVFFYQIPSINSFLLLVMGLIYCCIYAVSTFLTEKKRDAYVMSYNIKMALLFLISVLVINNPIHHLGWESDHNSAAWYLDQKGLPYHDMAFGSPPYTTADSHPKHPDISLGSIDHELLALNLIWKNSPDSKVFIAGKRNHTPLYICRVPYNNGSQIGVILNDQCLITFAGKSYRMNSPQILTTSGRSLVFWSPYPSTYPLVKLAVEPDDSSNNGLRYLTPCQTEVKGELYIGKVVFQYCNIAIGNSELLLPIQSILVQKKSGLLKI